VTLKLWDSWEDDVVICRQGGRRVGRQHENPPGGPSRQVFLGGGSADSPRSPQAYPLLVQAGSSDDGKDLAARYAEAVFTAQQTLGDAQAFYNDLKSRTHRQGRDPNTIKILPGIVPVLGSTEHEAKEREAELESHIVHEHAQRMLSGLLRVPVEQLDLDSQLPDICRPRARSRTSRAATRSSWRWADERN